MSIKKLVSEAVSANPIGLKEAFAELIAERVRVALAEKIANIDEAHGVVRKGGSIGEQPSGKAIQTYDDPEDAKDHAKRLNKMLSPDEKKHYGIKYHVKAIKEGFVVEETSAHVKDGYYVHNSDGKLTHDKPFVDSKAAIRHADKKEDESGRVHTVSHVKAGKINKQWQYNGGHSEGGWEHYSDYKGEPFHDHVRGIPKHLIQGQ